MKKDNHTLLVPSWTHRCGAVAVITGTLFAALAVHGQDPTLSVPNSSVSLDTTNGLYNWVLSGTSQMGEQAFFYSVGSGDLSKVGLISSGTTTSQTSSSITEKYANSTLSVTTGYTLGVDGSGAELSTSISLQNLSGISQTFHFYQDSYFTLGGPTANQNIQFLETTMPYEVVETGGGNTMTGTLSALAGGGLASVEEAAGSLSGVGYPGLGLVVGSPAPTFTDSPLSESGSDVNFGYEIDATLAPNSSLTISEIQVLAVPEPSCMALVSAGVLGLGLLRRRGIAFFKK